MHDDLEKAVEPASSAPGRRSFLGALIGVGTAGMGAILAIPLVRLAVYPAFADAVRIEWADVGPVNDFMDISDPVRRTVKVERRDGWRKVVGERSLYVVRGVGDKPRVLSTVCPHLGCAVAWDGAKRQFLSPCHGGVFAPDGALVAGPPRRGLDELESKVENGRLLVRYQLFRPLVVTKEPIA